MIKIPINLIKYGIGEPEQLGSVVIWNDATGTKTSGNYVYEIFHKNRKIATGEIKNFPRQRENSVKLLYLVLQDYYEKL